MSAAIVVKENDPQRLTAIGKIEERLSEIKSTSEKGVRISRRQKDRSTARLLKKS